MSEAAPVTPAAAGFAMPPEWAPHAGCLMAWPTRRELWTDRLDEAKRSTRRWRGRSRSSNRCSWSADLGDEAEVRDRCGSAVETLTLPIDDSWMRDSGPIFVVDTAGEVAVVSFAFNAWGGRWHPLRRRRRARPAHRRAPWRAGLRRAVRPRGRSISVDGEGTLITTEQCLLTPTATRDTQGPDRAGPPDYLGVTTCCGSRPGTARCRAERYRRPSRRRRGLRRARSRCAPGAVRPRGPRVRRGAGQPRPRWHRRATRVAAPSASAELDPGRTLACRTRTSTSRTVVSWWRSTGEPATSRRWPFLPGSTQTTRWSGCPGRRSPSAAAGCTASPSRSRWATPRPARGLCTRRHRRSASARSSPPRARPVRCRPGRRP